MIKSIQLINLDGEEITLKFHSGQTPYSVEQIIKTTFMVKEDCTYKCILESEISDDLQNGEMTVWLNNDEKKVFLFDNQLFFEESKDGKIFRDCLGFVQFKICVKTIEGIENTFYSDFASILVQDGPRISNINGMINYVYNNQSDLLKQSVNINTSGDERKYDYNDFWSQIVLLEEVVNVYESCYGFYKANCRYRLEQSEVLDRIDHLKYVDSKTVSYITQHPEYLHREKNGIRHGRQTFLPTKTMMNQNRISKDTYENQIILAFLRKVISDCKSLKRRIDSYINSLVIDMGVEEGYVLSSFILYVNAKNMLRKYSDKIAGIEERLNTLYLSYKEVLGLEHLVDNFIPKPTPIFLSVPQYNRIYLCITKWISKSGYDIVKELAMLNFYDAPSVYEAFVLIKLINQFKTWGYRLVEARNTEYFREPYWLYKNTEYNNTFVLKEDDKTVTIYYSPVIYDTDRSGETGISLYRNNSVSFRNGINSYSSYYVPDYVIKYEGNNGCKYVICDAKLSRLGKVREQLMPELAYKYLLSVSPTDQNSKLVGMDIFYGITELSNHSSKNFYDKELTNKVKPFASIIPMSLEIGWEEQEENLYDTLRELCYEE